jgi:hypothetical protein
LLTAVLLAASLNAQEEKKEKKVLKNADILMMVDNHFDDETLIKLIEVSDTDFDVSGNALIAMKDLGISPDVLRAMLQATQRKKRAANKDAEQSAGLPATPNPTPAPKSEAGSSAATVTSTEKPVQPASPAAASAPLAKSTGASPAAAASNVSQPQSTPQSFTVPPSNGAAMGVNPQQFAGMQSQMASMGLGGILSGLMGGGMFSMNYSAAQMPHVFLMTEVPKGKQEVSPSIAQIAQSKFKSGAPSPGGMALRSLATQGLSFASMAGGPAGMMAMSAFSMASGFMPGMRPGAPSMTYVWGLPGRKSARELTDTDPRFQLNYGDIPGVDPDAFEPAIIKLIQTPDNYRLVGATRTKMNMKNMMSGSGPEDGKWLSEERWPTRVYREERGFYVLRVDQPLESGEYAVVLRPVKGYKASPSGLGGHAQVFYSVWDFSVPGATPQDTSKKKKK